MVLACLSCGGDSSEVASPATDEPRFQNLDPLVAYVGTDACRSCHLGVFTTYSRTGMARSLRQFNAWRSDASEGQPLPPGVEASRIEYVVGSGHHALVLFGQDADRLIRLDGCWYADGARWETCPDDSVDDRHVGTGLPDDCLLCHDAAKASPTAGHGVDCERCHGPGELHVERWKGTADTGKGEFDPTIVNPRRLPRDERMAVCLQCHLGDTRAVAGARNAEGGVDSFRPGMALPETLVPTSHAQAAPREFTVSSQGDRLMLSRCYLESGERLDCMTCHNPHVTVYHADRPEDLFSRQCLRCHECTTALEHRQSTEPSDNCVACHMVRDKPSDQRNARYTDHWIRREP